MSPDILMQLVDVALLAPALGDGLQHFLEAQGPFPAGGAFAAGLVPGEVQEVLGDVHHAILFIHDDHAAGTHDGAQGRQGVIVHRGVQELLGDAAARGAAGLHRLDGPVAGDAAADVVRSSPAR